MHICLSTELGLKNETGWRISPEHIFYLFSKGRHFTQALKKFQVLSGHNILSNYN